VAPGTSDDDPDPAYDWGWTDDDPQWLPAVVNHRRPNVARMHDYYLDGKDNFAIDRAAAEGVLTLAPDMKLLAQASRDFLVRAVSFMSDELDIHQFLDLGTGIPRSPSVHEVARASHRGARVIYVDFDPVVLAHTRALLATVPGTASLQYDLRHPALVLADTTVKRLIDFTEPVGLLLTSVLHFVDLDVAPGILAQYARALPPGSAIAISLACGEGTRAAAADQAESVYAGSNARIILRSTAQVDQLFEGWQVVEPGVVDLGRWRHTDAMAYTFRSLGGVGVKR
jgi:hypothetical protein